MPGTFDVRPRVKDRKRAGASSLACASNPGESPPDYPAHREGGILAARIVYWTATCHHPPSIFYPQPTHPHSDRNAASGGDLECAHRLPRHAGHE